MTDFLIPSKRCISLCFFPPVFSILMLYSFFYPCFIHSNCITQIFVGVFQSWGLGFISWSDHHLLISAFLTISALPHIFLYMLPLSLSASFSFSPDSPPFFPSIPLSLVLSLQAPCCCLLPEPWCGVWLKPRGAAGPG